MASPSWLRRHLATLLLGPIGTAGFALIPRAVSGAAQWTLALRDGTAAVTPYVTTTLRGSAAISILAAALPPILAERHGSLRTRQGGRVLAGALLLLGLLAGALTLGFESSVGIGFKRGAYCAAFATVTLFQAGALGIWPHWQIAGQHLAVMARSSALFVLCLGLAWFGFGELSAIAGSLAAGFPILVLLGPFPAKRAVRFGYALARRAIPLSIVSTATAAIFPMAMSRAETLLGPTVAGHQMLFWSCALPMTFVSQAVAARVLPANRDNPSGALRDWGKLAVPLVALAFVVYSAFRWVLPRYFHGASPLAASPVLFVVAASFILSDPICFFFCPPDQRSRMARGSVAVALLICAGLLLWPKLVVRTSVVGPSGIVAVMRLAFIRTPHTQALTTSLILLLSSAFALAIWLG